MLPIRQEIPGDDGARDRIDNASRAIIEGLGRMLKLFQEGVVPEKIPELMLSINEKFLKSLGDAEDMRRQLTKFEKEKKKANSLPIKNSSK